MQSRFFEGLFIDMEDYWNVMLTQRRLLSNQLGRLSEYLEFVQLRGYAPQSFDVLHGAEYSTDHCNLYSMENSSWEQESHPQNQFVEERLSNLENVLMQFMEVSQASFEANQNSIKNLEIEVGKLATQIAERTSMAQTEENLMEINADEESPHKEHDSREKGEAKEKAATVEEGASKQYDKCLQVNISLPQLTGKEERHGEFEKFVRAFNSLFTNTSSTMVWKSLHGFMLFMEFLPKKRKMKEDVFFLTYMTP